MQGKWNFSNFTGKHLCCSLFLTALQASQKMKFSIKDFLSKCDQIRRKLQIWSHLLKKSLMENIIFCETCNVIKKRLQHRCFPVKLTKFFRTPVNDSFCSFHPDLDLSVNKSNVITKLLNNIWRNYRHSFLSNGYALDTLGLLKKFSTQTFV